MKVWSDSTCGQKSQTNDNEEVFKVEAQVRKMSILGLAMDAEE